ncbi:MAG TPA: molybdenum cofactor biosynthesis protein MoaE [Terriglobales bacterium]|nr:molybdenum cofactor biosynthesis protein MoaE [Terriglobales bacterium]
MQVRVLFFGMLKDVTGRVADVLELPEGACLADLLGHYEKHVPKLKALLPSVAVAVNREYAAPESQLHGNDEVALLPPVSGGAPRAQLVRQRIDAEAVIATVKRPEDGAVVVFDGIVRNNTRGRPTQYLDYEAYEEMALKQMEELATEALRQFAVREIAIVHRLGRLEIGETSVLIAVASAHRGSAFDACRWVIDTLKRTVPIWKKEYFADGAVWADGEPFPERIPRAEGTHSGRPASK